MTTTPPKNFHVNQYPLWTAVITPFTPEGAVDYTSFEKTLKLQEDANNGIVVLGSTGEGLNLGQSTALEIFDWILGLALKIPVMAGIPGFNLPETLAYVKKLNARPSIHGFLVVTPLYAKPGDHGQYEWFKSILDASLKPCMLYNVPGRSGVKMSFQAVAKLHGHKNFWAIKEASGSVEDFRRYHEMCPNVDMYSGDDGLIADFREYGLKGLVSVASNPWPKATHLYLKKVLEGTLTPHDVGLWKEWCDSLFTVANPVPAKVLMHQRGLIAHPNLQLPLHHQDLLSDDPTIHKKWQTVLKADEQVNQWFKDNTHSQGN